MPTQCIAPHGTSPHYPAYATVQGMRGLCIAGGVYNAASQMAFLLQSAPAAQDAFAASLATAADRRHRDRGHYR